MSQFIVRNWNILQRNNIIELGSGCGMAGITCAKLNKEVDGSKIFLTDYDNGSLKILRDNIELNDCAHNCSVHEVEWGKTLPTPLSESANDLTLIIGSDLLYCAGVVRPLIKTVHAILSCSPPSSIFVLASSFDFGKVSFYIYSAVYNRLILTYYVIIRMLKMS